MTYPKFSLVDNEVRVSADVHEVYCPDSVENFEVRHPRVYIPLINGQGVCPYCGTVFTQEKDINS